MSTALHPHERQSLRKRRIVAITMGVAFFCVLGLVGVIWFWSHRQSQRVNKILSAAAERGEPINGRQLNAYFKAPSGEEDATHLWVAGIDRLIAPGVQQQGVGLPFVGDDATGANIDDPIPEYLLKGARAHLEDHAQSLEKFHAAAALGGRARLPVDFRDGVGALLPYAQGARDAARLLQLDIRVKYLAGDARGCANSLRTLLILSRCLEREPCAVSQNICGAIEVIGVDSLGALLGVVKFTDGELEEFAAIIASRDAQARLREGLRGERVMGVAAFDDPSLLIEGPQRFLITNADLALYLEHVERMITANEKGFPECLVAVQSAQDVLERQSSEGIAALTTSLTRSLNPDFKKNVFMQAAIATAKNRAAASALAVERFRNANQRMPKTFAELVPQWLPAEPIDPFVGKPLIFRIVDPSTPSGYFLYSVGDDARDHGGVDLNRDDPGLWIPLASNPKGQN